MRTLTLLLTTLLAVGVALAGPAEDELKKTEKGWAAAVVARDYAKLDRVLNNRLIYAHSTGVIETKSDYLGKLKSGKQRYDVIDHQKMEVRVHGNAAVVHSLVRMQGESATGPFDNKLMMIHTWVKSGGAWQLAAHQTTKLTE